MRIISKYHDYYDTILSYGMDKNVTYIRKKEKVSILLSKNSFLNKVQDFKGTYSSKYINKDLYIIGFCGNVYPVFKLTHESSDPQPYKKIVEAWAYSSGDIAKFYFKTDKELYKDFMSKKGLSNYRYSFSRSTSKETIDTFFKNFDGKNKCEDIFREHNVPVFFIKVSSGSYRFFEERHEDLMLNPCLRDLEFFKIIDPYTAFQEIDMYLSGVLGVGEPKIITLTDEEKIQKRGFDKWSFRKQSTKKRGKK